MAKKINTEVWVERKYLKQKVKYMTSIGWYVALNVSVFVLGASLVILNLYAIKMNPTSDTKIMFVALAILSAAGALITSIISFFSFRKTSQKNKEKLDEIQREVESHKAKENEYSSKDRDHILIKKITNIYNEEK